MNSPFLRPCGVPALAAAIAALVPFASIAQQPASAADASACVSMESDQARLACYDAALGRAASAPAVRQADEAAAAAKQALKLDRADDAGRGGNSDLYASEPERAIANAGKGSLLDSRWELARDSKLGTFNMRAYKPVYLLPGFWSSDPNTRPTSPNPDNTVATPQDLDSVETKFQLSFKTKAVENIFGDNGDLWMAYTQSSRWQVYNAENSRPFRETNYEPEVMLVFRNAYHFGGWSGRMTGIGINHQSNGRANPFSRSWNRVILDVGLDRENWALVFRPWYRIPESRKDDNNPDIEDYMGRGDLLLVHTRGEHEFSLMGRHSLRSGDRSHGAVEFDWGFPITRQLRGHLQVFDGYGESMIDYNHRATYVGLGISLLEWF